MFAVKAAITTLALGRFRVLEGCSMKRSVLFPIAARTAAGVLAFPYSERSASVTSTRAARSAGNIDAMIAAANSTPTDTTSGKAVGICKSGK